MSAIPNEANNSVPSQITILRPTGSRMILTKRFQRDSDGNVEKSSYSNVKNFSCEQVPVAGIEQLIELLAELELQPSACIIRGEPLPDVDLSRPVKRRLRKQGDEEPYFRSVADGQPWVCIDFDDIECPESINPESDPGAAMRYLRSLLPPEFHDAIGWWQLSSSAGVRGWDLLRAHLWFWLDRGVPDDDLRRWANTIDADIDPTLFNAVQVHYTAAPIFDGMPDPVSRRSGLLLGLNEAVQLRIAQKTPPSPKARASGELVETVGFEGLLAQIGDHEGGAGFHEPITRAIASYVATNGSEFDREALKERVREAILSAENHHRDQSVIDNYCSDNDLDASIEGAIAKFGTKTKGRLIPNLEPHFNANELAPADAKTIVEECVTYWWDRRINFQKYQSMDLVTEWPPADPWNYETGTFHDWAYDGRSLVVLGAAGIGKSRIAVDAVSKLTKEDPGAVVWYLTPTVELAQELAGVFGRGARVIRGRTHKDENGETLCLKPEAVEAVAGRVPSITRGMCKNDNSQCEYYERCPYYEQYIPRSFVYFMSHEYAFQPRYEKVLRPDFVIIDENILSNFVVMPRPFSPEEFIVSAGRYAPLARFIVAALEEGESPKSALKELRPYWTPSRLRKADKRLAAAHSPAVKPGMNMKSIRRALGSSKGPGFASLVFRIIADEYSLERDECYSVVLRDVPVTRTVSGIQTDTHEKLLFVQYRRKMQIKRGTPHLLLDATGNAELLAPNILGLRSEQIDASRNAYVIQTYGFRAAKTALVGDSDYAVRHQGEVEELLKSFPSNLRGLLVTHKDAVEQITVSDNWDVVHLGNLRGIDKYKKADIVIIAGRLQPPPAAIERLAMGLSSDSERTLTLLKGDRYPEEERGYRMTDGSRFGVMVPCHPDPFVQALLEQTREAEIIQAVDRLRLRWNEEPKLVVILTEIPVDITVDALVPYRDLVQGGGPFDKAAAALGGLLPADPKYLSRRFPEYWKSDTAARRALQRERDREIGLNDPNLYKNIYREWGTLIPGFLKIATPYSYRRQGQRGRASTCYSLLSEQETRAWLEGEFGELSAFGTAAETQMAA